MGSNSPLSKYFVHEESVFEGTSNDSIDMRLSFEILICQEFYFLQKGIQITWIVKVVLFDFDSEFNNSIIRYVNLKQKEITIESLKMNVILLSSTKKQIHLDKFGSN